MKYLIRTLVLTVLTAVCVTGQTPAALPTADQILEKYVQAVGGKAAIQKETSRVEKGTLEITAAGISGPLEVYSKAPNKSLFTLTLEGVGTIQRGFDGKGGWSQDPTGLKDLSGPELSSAKRDAEFYRTIKLKELYPTLVVKSKDKVGDHDAYVIEATPADGAVEKWYFDVQTGFLIRNDAVQEGPQGKIPVSSYLEDYKAVDGISVPFTIRQETGAGNITIKLTEIKHNVAIEDSKFLKPAQ